ncbi:hypothetical protein MGN70_004907 [Eutypa lata]|nr:hypothetical protein MGN70_004907 [Eutypa lata]
MDVFRELQERYFGSNNSGKFEAARIRFLEVLNSLNGTNIISAYDIQATGFEDRLKKRFAEAIGESLDEQFDLLHQIEMDSGQTRILLIDEMGRVIPKRSGHEQDLSLEVLGVIQLAVAIETSARGHLITIDSVKAELLRFPWPETSEMDLQHSKEQHKIIEKRLDLVSQMIQLAVLRTENLKQRASEQETAVRSINTDSRR